MIKVESIPDLRVRVAHWRRGHRVAFVPTMGNLHEGHLALVRAARGHAERVVCSIFVNPMQFGAGEDFADYPRTMARDTELLAAEGADLLFAPAVDVMYPRPPQEQTRVEVPGLSDVLCGASRPGHFVGVATVVCKLFNMVQADVALFGKKDYQQLMVIRRMVEDLCMPLEIVGIETVREPDGLALSSRNGYLVPMERQIAPHLYRALQVAARSLAAGGSDYAAVEAEAVERMKSAGLRVDYFTIRAARDLSQPAPEEKSLVLLVAAYLGRTRLIDNLELNR